jgi:hypothetical protein
MTLVATGGKPNLLHQEFLDIQVTAIKNIANSFRLTLRSLFILSDISKAGK